MERAIVTVCLVGCLTLGFLSLFSVYLPTQLSQAKGTLAITEYKAQASPSLSDVVDQVSSNPLVMVPIDESDQPAADEGIATQPIDNFTTEEFEEPEILVSSAKHRHHKKHKTSRSFQKPSRVKPVSEEVAKGYPLKMYEPLEEAPQRHYRHDFNVSHALRPAFEFWRNVYARYELNKTILHDNRTFNIIYGVLDFSNLDEDLSLTSEEKRRIRQGIEEKKKEDLKTMLLKFDGGELPRTAGEHIVYDLFSESHEPYKFKEGAERVRSQWGQKDRFMAGLKRAGRYMPMMEEIFIREGAPKEITRLVFVESMFMLNAVSKVGAAGPWQFMPATARHTMAMNEYVDERRDPLIAAQAAAKLLLKNYGLVSSWPLAVNGYNTGILRMVKAVDRLGTHNIATIIQNFEDPGYQFASRNFYPEFLAALEVADHHKDYFGNLELDSPVPFDELILPYPASLHELAETTATDANVLKDLNPAYYERTFLPHVALPKGYTIRVPRQQKMLFLAALDQIQEKERQVRWHTVGRGETLKQIAIRYQIPVALLRQANGLIDNRIRKGQPLKIPGGPTEVVLEVH